MTYNYSLIQSVTKSSLFYLPNIFKMHLLFRPSAATLMQTSLLYQMVSLPLVLPPPTHLPDLSQEPGPNLHPSFFSQPSFPPILHSSQLYPLLATLAPFCLRLGLCISCPLGYNQAQSISVDPHLANFCSPFRSQFR